MFTDSFEKTAINTKQYLTAMGNAELTTLMKIINKNPNLSLRDAVRGSQRHTLDRVGNMLRSGKFRVKSSTKNLGTRSEALRSYAKTNFDVEIPGGK